MLNTKRRVSTQGLARVGHIHIRPRDYAPSNDITETSELKVFGASGERSRHHSQKSVFSDLLGGDAPKCSTKLQTYGSRFYRWIGWWIWAIKSTSSWIEYEGFPKRARLASYATVRQQSLPIGMGRFGHHIMPVATPGGSSEEGEIDGGIPLVLPRAGLPIHLPRAVLRGHREGEARGDPSSSRAMVHDLRPSSVGGSATPLTRTT